MGGLYYLFTPRLLEISPVPGAENVLAGTPLRLTFSRPMQSQSVAEHLKIQPTLSGNVQWEGNTLIFTPDQPWQNGITVQISLTSGARASGWFAFPLLKEHTWSMTIVNAQLAYLYPYEGEADIYSIDPYSGETQQLIDSPDVILDFSISSTGNEIYYSVRRSGSGSAIYRLDRMTGETALIIEFHQALCRFLQLSPKDDYLAYECTNLNQTGSPASPQVWLLPILEFNQALSETLGKQHQPFLVSKSTQTQQPQWSPKGWLTYYDPSLSSYMIYNPYSGENYEIPSQTGSPGTWHPNGEVFVFPEILTGEEIDSKITLALNPIPTSHLISYQLSDSSLHDLSLKDNLEDTSPAFSPDGNTLALARKYLNVSQWTPGRQLWFMRSDGSQARPITQDPQYNHYDFAWSRSGEWLAYVRFNVTELTEPPEIWLVNFEGEQARLLVGGGYAPQLIP